MFSLKDFYTYTPMKEQTNLISIEDEDQAEEALSLCDLPIYSHSSSDLSNTSKGSDETSDDSFEFFTTQSHPKIDHIIFCGKSIPCRETPTYQERQSHKKSGMSYFLGRVKRCSSSKSKTNGSLANGSEKNNAPKFKWCFFLFGLQRFSVPTKMELADMKYRQSRRGTKSLEMLARSSSESNSKLDKGLSYLLRSLSCKRNHSLYVLE